MCGDLYLELNDDKLKVEVQDIPGLRAPYTVKPCYTGTPLTGKLAITDGLRRFWNDRANFYWLYRTNSKPDRTRNLKNKKIIYIEY